MAMKMESLETLFVDSIRDLYDAENQIMDALPKMVDAASSSDLKMGLQQHLDVTKHQAQRLEQVFSDLNQPPKRKKCYGMEGIIHEGQQDMKDLAKDKDVLDAGLIAAAQKVEHYEISGYGTAKTYAHMLGHDNVARLLDQTLSEEYAADDKLTRLAESHINVEAM